MAQAAKRVKTEIQSTAIYKILGHECWMVPSDSTDDMYKVCYNKVLNIWECECRHGIAMAKFARNAHCKHVRAVQISIKANMQQADEVAAQAERDNMKKLAAIKIGSFYDTTTLEDLTTREEKQAQQQRETQRYYYELATGYNSVPGMY